MRKFLFMLCCMLLCVLPAFADDLLYVNGGSADRVHLRLDPNTQAESMGLYYSGTPVTALLTLDSGWTQVRIGADTGYMMSRYLSPSPVEMAGPTLEAYNPAGSMVYLRASARTRAAVACEIANGTVVQALGQTASGWHYVLMAGQTGYAQEKHLVPSLQMVSLFSTQIVGVAATDGFIHACTLTNGQTIFFTSHEQQPTMWMEDVNFDGAADVVVATAMGANNMYCEFYLWSGGEYGRVAPDGGEERLCNYQLHPECGVVASYANTGNAGLLHVWNLYRWEGTELKLIRSAVSDEWTEDIFQGQTYTSVIHGDVIHMTVRDHTLGSYDDCIVWEVIMPKADIDFDSLYEQEMEALWKGVR